MKNSVIIDGLRSPIGINKGNLRGIRPDDLSSIVIKKLLEKNPVNQNLYEELHVFHYNLKPLLGKTMKKND